MRVKWEKREDSDVRSVRDGAGVLYVWPDLYERAWTAQYVEDNLGAMHHGLPSERAAKREAVRMWRALRGSK